MTLIMRDATNPFNVPLDNLNAVAGYADGIYTWSSEGWSRFQSPIVSLSIVCVNPADSGDILDYETGCANGADPVTFRNNFNRPNRRRATIYVNRANWQTVFDMVGNTVDYWVATLDGTTDVTAWTPPGCTTLVAIQYTDHSGIYDESIIVDPTWIQSSVRPTVGGNMIGLSYRPGGVGDVFTPSGQRADIAYISPTNTLIHAWNNSDKTGWHSEDLGGVFNPAFGATCAWDDKGFALTFTGVGTDGNIYTQSVYGLAGTINTQNPPTGWQNTTLPTPQTPPSALSQHFHTESGNTGPAQLIK